ncbi:PREDICTED: transmembrane protein 223 [Dinoponera quadriceps]|uniref:Transmembrane protein 223 n=1 Tax=Dinoponera quadriceps TaxID=609295 RepID=A0A6P3XAJ3_DINQU|nr:PREDICTED: transmembrane protein 223 [Dinoponera quadriceps]XP_014475278.1 PREDICTED: transmembrane protein 223 [Dinoponera quadriceps]
MLSAILKHLVPVKPLLTDIRSICKISQQYLKHSKNVFSMALTVRTFLTRSARISDGLIQSTRLFKPNKLPQNLLVRHQQTIKLDIDTNVCNNVILYKNENQRYVLKVHFVAIAQFVWWSTIAFYSYRASFWDIFYTDITLQQHLYNHLITHVLFTLSVIIAPLTYVAVYALFSRTIRYIVLHKGGEKVTLTTSHLWKKNDGIQVPVGNVKCLRHRTATGIFMLVKVKDKRFYYLIEKKGTFLNPELFDYTLGFSQFRK